MNTCDTCKWWGTSPEPRFEPHLRGCSSDKNMAGYHVEHVPDDGMLVENDEGWGFVTGPKFGCVHHELK